MHTNIYVNANIKIVISSNRNYSLINYIYANAASVLCSSFRLFKLSTISIANSGIISINVSKLQSIYPGDNIHGQNKLLNKSNQSKSQL